MNVNGKKFCPMLSSRTRHSSTGNASSKGWSSLLCTGPRYRARICGVQCLADRIAVPCVMVTEDGRAFEARLERRMSGGGVNRRLGG